MLCFLLPKKIRKIMFYFFIFGFCCALVVGFTFLYVILNLRHTATKNMLKITNTTSFPITIYSVNDKILDQMLNKNESCIYKMRKSGEITICAKFLKFSYKYAIKPM